MSPLGYIAISALIWSTFPVVVALGVTTFDFVALYTTAIGISTAWHLLIIAPRFKRYFTIFRGNVRLTLLWATLAGTAITVASFSYYAAMQAPNKIVPAILLELWPMLSMFFGAVLSRNTHWARMPSYVWLCALAALLGTSIISANGGLFSIKPHPLYLVALVGAIFYGLSGNLQAVLGSRLADATESEKTLITRLFSDGIAFLMALFIAAVRGTHIPTDPRFIFSALYLGTLVYALSAFLFNHGLRQAHSPSINLLFYFSPVLSILWLDLLGYGQLTSYVILGSALILSANIIVISEYRYAPSTIYTLIATLFFAFVVVLFHGFDLKEPTDFVAVSSGIFAIIAGFSLTRLHGRNANEEQLRLAIANRSYRLVDLAKDDSVEFEHTIRMRIDDLFIKITDYEYCAKQDARLMLLESVYACERQLTCAIDELTKSHPIRDDSKKILCSLLENIDMWVSRKAERLSLGEILSLALIGSVAISGLVLNRAQDIYSSLSSIFISTGISFTLFKIVELGFGQTDADFSSILSGQQLFRRLGVGYYLPHSVVTNRAFPAPSDKVKFRHVGPTGEMQVTEFRRESFLVRNMAIILFAISLCVILAVLLDKFHFISL